MIYTPCPYYSCFTRSMTSFSKKISMTEAVYALVKRSDEERKKHPERFTNPSLDQWRLWIVEDKWYKNFPKVSKIAGRDLQITKEEIINRVFYQTYNLTEKSNSLLKCFLWLVFMITGYARDLKEAIEDVFEKQVKDVTDAVFEQYYGI